MAVGAAKVATVAEDAAATSITGNQPAGLADGDVVFAEFANTSNISNFTPPSGIWSEFVAPRAIGSDQTYAAYIAYLADAGDWVAPTASWTTTGRASCIVTAYSGTDPASPVDVGPSLESGTAPLVIGEVTTTRYGAKLITGAAANTASSNTIAVPSGFTEQAMTTGTGRRMGWGDKATTTAGASGDQTWTCSGALSMTGFLAALRPWWPSASCTVTATIVVTAQATRLMAVSSSSASTTTVACTVTAVRPTSATTAAVVTVSADATIIPGAPEQAEAATECLSTVSATVGTARPAACTVTATSTVTAAVTIAHYGAFAQTDVVSGVSCTVDNLVLGAGAVTAATSAVSCTIDNYTAAVTSTTAAVAAMSCAVTMTAQVSAICAATATVTATPGAVFIGAATTSTAVCTVSAAPIVAGKPTQGTKVLELFNPDEVLTGGRVTSYEFDLLDADERYLGQLVGVESGELAFDAYASVKGSGKLMVSTEPSNTAYPEGQPAFLGIRRETPTGVLAEATTDSSPDLNTFLCADADAVEISPNDLVMLRDSGGDLKQSTVFTVLSKVSSAGTTTITFTPDADEPAETGDFLVVVELSYDGTIDWLNVRVRPSLRIARLGGHDDPLGTLVPLGVFLCAAPPENWEATGLRRDLELLDKLSILDQDIASGSSSTVTAYTADAGDNILDLVKALIEETGEACPAIIPDTKTVAAPMVWDVGTTRLRVINDLLDAAAYFSLYCDGRGQYQAVPYVQPSDRTPVYESIAPFSSGPMSLMDPSWVHDRDIYSIPNRCLLISQGEGDTEALTAVATNIDPTSPYSYPSRGRWITKVETGVEAADQAALDKLAAARLSRESSVTNQIEVKHAFLPDLHMNSVVRFVNPSAALDTYCYVIYTTVPLDPGGLCSTVMRIVT